MLHKRSNAAVDESFATLAAIDGALAKIEFSLDGEVLSANANFLSVMGYAASEIIGKRHAMFCAPAYVASAEYQAFWEKLRRGEFVTAQVLRLNRAGGEVWLQATYIPVRDRAGRLTSVLKLATDVTQSKSAEIGDERELRAIHRSQATISFATDGTILSANQNFLDAMGYRLDEIKGRHHRMFVDAAYAASAEYEQFWSTLRRGDFVAREFQRFGKGGREVWIQASYNPMLDAQGKVIGLVKIATDVTERVRRETMLSSTIDRDLNGIASNAQDVLERSRSVAGATTETASTLQGVAAAAEELDASIREIAAGASSSQQTAQQALQLTLDTDKSAETLTRSAQQMTGIVDLIDNIASQINLLALNATIESARAGEAGRGFAVVAAEVKQLAAQVSAATKTINTEIRGVQSASSSVAEALRSIRAAVEGISNDITAVVDAVNQQSSATAEISSTMQTASGAVGDVERGLIEIAKATEHAKTAALEVRENVRGLAR